MPKRQRTKRNNISVHQRIKCAREWQRWLETQSKKPNKRK